MKNLTSSNLSGVDYDPLTKTLEIQFKNGSIYIYKDVPESVYQSLLNAESHGQYFAQNIKHIYGR